MDNSHDNRIDFWAETWIGAVVLILLSCSFFSLFSLLRFGAWIGGTAAVLWTLLRIHRAGRSVFSIPRFHGIGWGIPVLIALCLVSLLVGPHCFLDTYSYRLPQMFFWLQEGHPWSVPGVDMRINQMPHVWPMLSAAFYLPLGERALALPNFIGLLFLAALFRRWAAAADGPNPKSDAIALVFLSAPIFLMGASTNDNVVSCCAFLALSYHFATRPEASLRTVTLSALSFALACGIKPQYLALAPVWAAWFFFAPSRPWRTLRLKPLLVLLPLLILCSPVPTLAVNRICWGSFMHPNVVERMPEREVIHASSEDMENGPSLDTGASTEVADVGSSSASAKHYTETFRGEHALISLTSQFFALPFNPFFGKCNAWVARAGNPASRFLKRTGVKYQPLVIPEIASFELLVALALVAGLLFSVISTPRQAVFVGLTLALTILAAVYTNGGTIGRSFAGFFVILIPVAALGIARLPRKPILAYATLSFLTGVAVIVTDPSQPLLPLRYMARKLSSRPAAAAQLAAFAHFSERQHAARGLLEAIPDNTDRIGVVLEGNSPFGDLWLSRPKIRVIPYSDIPTSSRLDRDGVRHVIFKSKQLSDSDGKPNESLIAEQGLRIAKTSHYVSFTHKGPEPWLLLTTEPALTPER